MKDNKKTKAQLLAELAEQRKQNKLLRYLAENSKDMLYSMSLPDGKYEYVSPASSELFGYSPEQFYESPLLIKEIIHPDWHDYFTKQWKNLLAGNVPPFYEYQIIHKSGDIKWMNQRNVIISDKSGNPAAIEGIVTDITDRKQAEKALKIERDKAEMYLKIAGVILIVINADQTVQLINKKGCEILGYSEHEIIGKNWFDHFLPKDNVENVKHVFNALMQDKTEVVEYFENQMITKNGEIRCVAWHNALIKDETGAIFGTLSSGEDITERKRAEESLRESELRFRTIVETNPNMLYITDEHTNNLYVSPNSIDFTGYTQDELLSNTINFVHEDDVQRLLELRDISINEKKGYHNIDYKALKKNGEVWYASASWEPLLDNNKTLRGFIISISDITDRTLKQIEYSQILKTATDGFWVVDTNGQFMEVNPAAADMLGYSVEELLTLGIKGVDSTEKSEEIRERFQQIKKAGTAQFECIHRRKDGSLIDVEISGSYLPHSGGRYIIFLRDVTERKRSEEALRDSEERYHTLFDLSPVGFALSSIDGKILDSNDSLCSIFGLTREEILKINADELYFNKEQRNKFLEEVKKHNYIIRQELDFRKSDSSVITALLSSRFLPDIDTGILFSIFEDITDHKKLDKERQKLEEQLRQSQKMEAIGTLSGGIAHDFNNILTAIIGYTELASDCIKNHNYDVLDHLNTVLKAGNRAKDLIGSLLKFSRNIEIENEPLEIRLVVKEAVKLLRATIPSSIEINEKITIEHENILATSSNIHQIVMNLCTNAYHAMPDDKGIIYVGLEKIVSEQPIQCRLSQIPSGTYIRLHVGDTGSGISLENIEKIFDPYFSSKRPGEGTGLGLTVTSAIIKSLGGGIIVSSEIGKGTDFYVYFPVVFDSVDRHTNNSFSLQGGNERILLVDDEYFITDLNSKILESLGYKVEISNESPKALEIFSSCPNDYDVIITDQTMPHMTGLDLTRRVHEIRPDIPIIICTGFSELINMKKKDQLGVSHVLFKPTTKRDLAEAVRKVLNNG